MHDVVEITNYEGCGAITAPLDGGSAEGKHSRFQSNSLRVLQ